jgi:hypothetical protein
VTADPWRVAQIAVEHGPTQDGFKGSGYLVAPGRVLTAAHVLDGGSAVRIRLDVGQRSQIEVEAETWWADPAGADGTDLAVIIIPEDVTAERSFEPARFGCISDCAAVVPVSASGFPLFKLRDKTDAGRHKVFRDFEQVTAHAPVAANRRHHTLAVYLDDPSPRPPSDPGSSPWEGMSGAAVWAADRIVGVIAENHHDEGTGRLTAHRIDRVYEQLSEFDLGVVTELLGLPSVVGDLPDVVPAEPGQLLRSAYLAQVRDIAPDELVGRDGELEEWAEFCADADSYGWWQAAPWAGKTALASWFVTNAPAGLDIVSFFITGRLRGQADADAFLEAMIEQLQALHPSTAGPTAAGARIGMWLNLLESAAAHAEERGRRLVVVVDGLDEDDAGAAPRRGRPSIASLLPRRPPPGARFIITSRPDPGLPDDLPAGHPLGACVPKRLPVSWIAQDVGMRARQELRDLLSGDQIAVDLVGYIAGSGGGLTRKDLSSLTGAPPHKLEPFLRGVSGRSLQTQTAPGDSRGAAEGPETRVYLFAHDTLRISAEEQLGGELSRYRSNVHDWIDSYSRAGWPDTTPGYAIRGYAALLAATDDTKRLLLLACDPGRHAFLLQATGSDYAAVTEIRTAQVLIADCRILDLKALVLLAAHRHAISLRTKHVPSDLLVLWAQLGRFDHAEALARSIDDPRAKAAALIRLVTVAVEAADEDRARRLTAAAQTIGRTISDPKEHGWILARLATAIRQASGLSHAEAFACTITDSYHRDWALADLASAASQAGDLVQAEALARTIANPHKQSDVLAELVTATAKAGDPDHSHRLAVDAEDLTRTITYDYHRHQALIRLATATAEAGDLDHAEAIARTIRTGAGDRDEALAELVAAASTADSTKAEAIAQAIDDDYRQADALAALATAAAKAGDLDHAEAIARAIRRPDKQAGSLTGLAAAAARAGDLQRTHRLATVIEALAGTISEAEDQAAALTMLAAATLEAGDLQCAQRLAADAEAIGRSITHPDTQARVFTGLLAVAAQAGYLDRVRRLAIATETAAHTITDSVNQAIALDHLADAVAQTGDLDYAAAIALTITDPYRQGWALFGLAIETARAGDLERAEPLVRSITNPHTKATGLTRLAERAAEAGDLRRACRLAADAEAISRTITRPDDQDEAIAELVTAATQASEFQRAATLARAIANPEKEVDALCALVKAAGQAGRLQHAETLAYEIVDPSKQVDALTELTTVAAQTGDLDYARRLAAAAEIVAETVADSHRKDWAHIHVAAAMAQSGDLDHAEAIARAITWLDHQMQALIGLVSSVTRARDLDRAEAIARGIAGYGSYWARACTGLAAAAALAGDRDRARRLTADILALDLEYSRRYHLGPELDRLITALDQTGDHDLAETLTHTIVKPDDRDRVLAGLVTAAAQAGDFQRAEALTRAITDFSNRFEALGDLVTAAARRADLDQVESFARAAPFPRVQAWALAQLVTTAARLGELDYARLLAADADTLAHDEADPYLQSWALTFVEIAVAQAGDLDHAQQLATDAEKVARTITDPDTRTWALTRLAAGVVQAGDFQHADALAHSITPLDKQAEALTELATAAEQAGYLDEAGRFLARALLLDVPGIWWASPVSILFPSVIGDALDVLASAYQIQP